MDANQAGPKQRSPWFYVLLTLGVLAALSCLGVGGCVAYVYKKGNDFGKGLADPTTRTENARKMLGAIPEGYYVAAGVSMFGLVEQALLVDVPPSEDGGLLIKERMFQFVRITGNQQNEATKRFFTNAEADPSQLRGQGINLRAEDVIKRGQITVDGKKLYYVAWRGPLEGPRGDGSPAISNAVLFDCPGDAMHIGVWSMRDHHADQAIDALDLTGSVADEAEMARFFKPLSPCR